MDLQYFGDLQHSVQQKQGQCIVRYVHDGIAHAGFSQEDHRFQAAWHATVKQPLLQ